MIYPGSDPTPRSWNPTPAFGGCVARVLTGDREDGREIGFLGQAFGLGGGEEEDGGRWNPYL